MLADLPPSATADLSWYIAGGIVLLGLFIYGFSDLMRFSIGRAWAVSSVCFAESIRRRVLWITPLTILGVLVICQLQNPVDEQDAIRQTIKFTLFAAGLIVTVTGIILACTNLPKEIENRVIYTIVTKPTTRLDIVVGKIIGFAKVSATILLIMGLFTLGYLHVRAWSLGREIRQRLADGTIETLSRPTYEYWANHGLLSARTLGTSDDFEVYSREPVPGDTRRWIFGTDESMVVVPFHLTTDQPLVQKLAAKGASDPAQAALEIQLRLGYDRSKYGQVVDLPADAKMLGPVTPSQAAPSAAIVQVHLLDLNYHPFTNERLINNGQPIKLEDPSGQTPVKVFIPAQLSMELLGTQDFYIAVACASPGVEIFADTAEQSDLQRNPVCLILPGADRNQADYLGPAIMTTDSGVRYSPPRFRSRIGFVGALQLRGGKPEKSPVAVYQFHDMPPRSSDQAVPFELRIPVERNADSDNLSDATQVEVFAVNPKTGQHTASVRISPENNRTTYFTLPGSALGDGNFNIHVRNYSTGHFPNFNLSSLSMVASEESFDGNLLRSLLILWMLSIMVVIIAIFCSTFLSWPIAIVLTLLILLGHWGVMEVGDALAPGIGNQVAQDLFGAGNNASQARVVSAVTEGMARMLNTFGDVLPDITRFAAIDDIEKGITIGGRTLLDSLQVLLVFGLPMIVLSYVFLRNKEVAP